MKKIINDNEMFTMEDNIVKKKKRFKKYSEKQIESFINYCGNGQFLRLSRETYLYSRTSYDCQWSCVVKYENPCEWACVNEKIALNELCKKHKISLSKFFYLRAFQFEYEIMHEQNTTADDLEKFLNAYYDDAIKLGILDERIARAMIRDSVNSWKYNFTK